MGNEFRWGISLHSNYGSFLTGANLNIGKHKNRWYGYVCIYLGFKTVVVGYDDEFPPKKGNASEDVVTRNV